MVFEHESYRDFLKGALIQKKRKNRSFSLRSFAHLLGLQPSHLSLIYKGSKNLSPEKAHDVAKKLGLGPKEIEYFVSLVEFETTNSQERKNAIAAKLSTLASRPMQVNLNVDHFRLISDWYHLPIIELTKLEGFKLSAQSAANYLGITLRDAKDAMDRLERLEMIRKEGSTYLPTHDHYVFRSDHIPNSAFKHYHTQMIEKALECVHSQSLTERFVAGESMPINPSFLPQAFKILDECREKLSMLANQQENKTEVYQMCVQFFRLSAKPNPKKGGTEK